MIEVEPLNDDFVRNCPFWKDKFNYYLSEINKQLNTRPNVWGVGLWPDKESERIAKGIAELWLSYGEIRSTSFIPADKLRIIELADYEWGLVSSNLDDIEREFNCIVDVKELVTNDKITFGDLVALVKAREGSKRFDQVEVVPKGKRRLFSWQIVVIAVIGLLAWLVKSCEK